MCILLSGLMAAVIVYDVWRYIIPNKLNLLILAFFPVWGLLMPHPVDWLGGAMAAGVLFAAGFVLFACKVMGGGDVKLFTVCGFYVGWGKPTLMLVFDTAILGGVLCLVILGLRYFAPPICSMLGMTKIPKVLTFGESLVPYGPAIATSMLILIWTHSLPGIQLQP